MLLFRLNVIKFHKYVLGMLGAGCNAAVLVITKHIQF